MKRFLAGVIVVVVLTAQTAQADRGRVYVSGSLGYGVVADGADIRSETGIDTGWGLIGAVGYDTNRIRFEGEISLRKYKLDEVDVDGLGTLPVDGDLSAFSYMANGFYDFKRRTSPYRPYLGMGFGITRVDVNIDGQGEQGSTEMAFQFMGGVSIGLARRMFLRAGYRLFGYTNNDGNLIHELNLGAGFLF